MFKFVGKVESIVRKEHEGKVSYNLQFLDKTPKGFVITNIKADSLNGVVEGEDVELNISISSFEGKIYYKVI